MEPDGARYNKIGGCFVIELIKNRGITGLWKENTKANWILDWGLLVGNRL